MTNVENATPICPGCHFRCTLDNYQCGRGAKFNEKWLAGEEIPERRAPWEQGDKKPDGKSADIGSQSKGGPGKGADGGHKPPKFHASVPTPSRLMMLIGMANRMITDRNNGVRDQRIAECIMRQGGSATNRIIAERTRLDDAAIDEQIAGLEEQGIVTSRTLEDGRVFHDLTEHGREQAKTWIDDHRAADAEFYSALTGDEADQLEALLAKALEPHMRRPRER